MRIRTEAVGGYDFSGLIAIVLAILGLGLVGLVMLVAGIMRRAAGRPSAMLLIVGVLIALPGAALLVGILSVVVFP